MAMIEIVRRIIVAGPRDGENRLSVYVARKYVC